MVDKGRVRAGKRLRTLLLGHGSWRAAMGPTLFALVAIALLVYDHLHGGVTELVFWLTLALIAAVFARTIEPFANNPASFASTSEASSAIP